MELASWLDSYVVGWLVGWLVIIRSVTDLAAMYIFYELTIRPMKYCIWKMCLLL
jgi:hypothetical protein